MNPLLFMPSPRDIPSVKRLWSKLNYDQLIIKYKPQHIAYAEAKTFFLEHEEYDRLVICADDLEIESWHLNRLLEDSEIYDVIDGYCNLDESMSDYYDIQPLGCDLLLEKPRTDFGAWYMKDKKPKIPEDTKFLQVGHSGAACRVITRDVFKKLSFVGANKDNLGWFDYQMSKDLSKHGIPIYVNLTVLMRHLRTAQKPYIDQEGGYTLFLRRPS